MKDDFLKEHAIGDRVRCFKFIGDKELSFIGYGTYEGMYHFGNNNIVQKIKLDNDKLIYAEEMSNNLIIDLEVISVTYYDVIQVFEFKS